MRVLLSTYGLRGDVEPMVGLAMRLRALGAEVRVCAPLVPVGRLVRPMVNGARPRTAADLPRRAAELVAAQFDSVAAAAEWVSELAATIYRTREVTGIAQDDTGVDVELSDGPSLRAEYLVGCDGGRCRIRKAAGIEFPGWDPTTSNLIAEVELAEEPEWSLRRDALGIYSLSTIGDGVR